MLGYFNEILTNDEKFGGEIRTEKQIGDLRQLIEDCEMGNLKFQG